MSTAAAVAAALADAGADPQAERRVARRFRDLDSGELDALLWTGERDERMVALLVMVDRSRSADDGVRDELARAYLDAARGERIDDAGLVDVSAGQLVGVPLIGRSPSPLFALAKSDIVWERRIAVLAAHALLTAGDAATALDLSARLVREKTPTIQQAVGRLLREVGDRVARGELLGFLDAHARTMGEAMLAGALEHLPDTDRERYLRARRPR